MGNTEYGALLIDQALADWESRDKSYDTIKQYDVLCKAYTVKWSFLGDLKSLHLAVR